MADSIFDQLDKANQISSAAQAAGLRPEFVHSIIRQESAGNERAVSPKGAVGIMQVMPATAANPGFGVKPFDPYDPNENLHGGLAYLKALYDHFGGDEGKTSAAYNAGPGAVDSGRASSFPETNKYVAQVSAHSGAPAPTGDIFSQLDAAKAATGTSADAAQKSAAEPASLSGYVNNWGPSAAKFGKGVADIVSSPFQTLNTMGKGLAGAVENLAPNVIAKTRAFTRSHLPDSWRNPDDPSATPKQTADAMGEFAKNRYGSWDAIKNTLYTDPVGSLADVAGVLTGVGGATKLAGATRIGGAIARAGEMIDPLQAAIKGTSALVQGPAERVAQHVTNVNMQIPKALRRRELGSPFTPAEAVLNEGRGTNPFTRLSQGGLNNAEANGAKLTDQFNAVLDKDLPKKYPIDSIDQILADQQSGLMHDINGQPKAAQVQTVRDNLANNPLYSKAKMGPGPMVSQDIQVPHPFATDASGNPIMQTQTRMVPGPDVEVGRQLVPQTAKELNVIKGNVDKGLTFGERGGTLEEAQKAARRGVDQIIDQNVPGAKALNDRRAQNVVATKALQDAILARQTKRHAGMAEALLFGAPIALLDKEPVAAAAFALPWAYNSVVKHPTLSSPIAAGAHAVGTYSLPAAAQAVLPAVTPASRINEASQGAEPTYPTTASDVMNWFKAYLGRNNDNK